MCGGTTEERTHLEVSNVKKMDKKPAAGKKAPAAKGKGKMPMALVVMMKKGKGAPKKGCK